MDPESLRGLQTAPSRNFSRPFPSPLTTSSLENADKISRDRDLFHRLPHSASLFNLSRRPRENGYLATNRSMEFNRTATSTSTPVSANRPHRPAKIVRVNKPVHPDLSAGTLHSSTQNGQEEAAPSFNVDILRHAEPHHAEHIMTDFSSGNWRTVPRDARALTLQLFREVNVRKTPDTPKTSGTQQSDDECEEEEDEEEGEMEGDDAEDDEEHLSIVPTFALYPLFQFRQLAYLGLTGMMKSYQPLIWRVVWLLPFLRSLHLSMALSPVFNVHTDQPHQLIDGAWTLNNGYRNDLTISEYLGHHGEGILHEEFGEGEYLDSQAINMARQHVLRRLPFNNERYLPVEKLSLERFVVDGGAIMRWFDPRRLREIEFGDRCVDAGLYLKPEMSHVKITAPSGCQQYHYCHHHHLYYQHMGRAVKMGELKTVDLKKGRIVSRKDARTGREELDGVQKQPGLKAKMSQLMHGWASKRKGD